MVTTRAMRRAAAGLAPKKQQVVLSPSPSPSPSPRKKKPGKKRASAWDLVIALYTPLTPSNQIGKPLDVDYAEESQQKSVVKPKRKKCLSRALRATRFPC